MKNIQSRIVGISITIAHLSDSLKVTKIIKNNSPDTIVILGGPGVNLAEPQKFLSNGVDFIVRGEAEKTLPLLLEKIEKGLSLKEVPNLIYKKNERIISTKRAAPPVNLDKLPFPDREIFDLETYFEIGKKSFGIKSLGMITSRGCPHQCIFCDRNTSGYKFRARSPKNVVDELELLEQKYSLDKVFIQDDAFVRDRKRVLEICKEIRDRDLNIKWNALTRVDEVDEKMLWEMQKAGCEYLHFGVESGSERILYYLKKGFNVSQIIKAFDLCHEIGIKPGASLIVGIPGEKKEDINATIKLIRRIKPHYLGFSYLTPFPNTPLYNQTKQWISIKDFTDMDKIEGSVYQYPFEINPDVAYAQIYGAFREIRREERSN